MKQLFMENGFVSLNKKNEELCGDRVEVKQSETTGNFTMVLADGLGSGVKANILSTLTSKIIATMIDSEMPIEDCVTTIAQTLPICSVRQVAYATFTIIRVCDDEMVHLIQYDNPEVIMLRDGKSVDYERVEKVIADKKIYESLIPLRLGDVYIAMSDGVIHAGVGKTLNFGWERPNVIEYVEQYYRSDMSAKAVSMLVSEACNDLYMGAPGDDTTVAALRIRERQVVTLLIGPPVNPADDQKVMELFFAQGGKTIVCGGTTSTIVANYLGEKIETKLDYIDPTIPPIGYIKGVDLCTEGVLTMKHVVEIAKRYVHTDRPRNEWEGKKDGASLIAQMLFEQATDVNLFIGRAMNPAHQNPNMPIDLSIKLRLIDDLSECLTKMGKRITVSYF